MVRHGRRADTGPLEGCWTRSVSGVCRQVLDLGTASMSRSLVLHSDEQKMQIDAPLSSRGCRMHRVLDSVSEIGRDERGVGPRCPAILQ